MNTTDRDGLSRAQKACLARVQRTRHSEPLKFTTPFLTRPACLIALFLCVWLLFAAGINFAIKNHWLPRGEHGYAVRVPGGLEIYP